MSRVYLFTFSVLISIAFAIIFQPVYINGFCPLCEKGTSTKSLSSYELMSRYMVLLHSYSYYRLVYSRLIEYGYSIPSNLTILFESGDNLFSLVRSLIQEDEYIRVRRLLLNLKILLGDINLSLTDYLESNYPNPMISRFYRASYKELITKIDLVTYLLSTYNESLNKALIDKLDLFRYSIKRLLNNPHMYSLYEHESTLRNADLFIWRVWLILNLDKTTINQYLDRDYLLAMRNNINNLLNKVSRIHSVSDILNNSSWALSNFPRLIDFLNLGDHALFVDNDVRRAYYSYFLVDGYLRYFIDNKDIFFNNLSHFELGIGEKFPYLLVLDTSPNNTLIIVAIDKVVLYKDIDGDGLIDPEEVVGEIALENALWYVEDVGHIRKFSFSNVYLNISVWVGDYGSEVSGSIYPFSERPLSGPWIKTIKVSYNLNEELFEGVDSALVVKVVDLEGGLNLRWDHFAATDSFNLDKFRNVPRVSIYINQFPTVNTRNIVVLYNKSCCPDIYEIALVPVSIEDNTMEYHYELWIKSGIRITDLDFYLSELYKVSPLLFLLIAIILSLILAYSVRYAFLVDIP